MSRRVEVNPGDRYGKWTVLKETEQIKRRGGVSRRAMLVVCNCGRESVVELGSLRQGGSKQCKHCSMDFARSCVDPKNRFVNPRLGDGIGRWVGWTVPGLKKVPVDYDGYSEEDVSLYRVW